MLQKLRVNKVSRVLGHLERWVVVPCLLPWSAIPLVAAGEPVKGIFMVPSPGDSEALFVVAILCLILKECVKYVVPVRTMLEVKEDGVGSVLDHSLYK